MAKHKQGPGFFSAQLGDRGRGGGGKLGSEAGKDVNLQVIKGKKSHTEVAKSTS